MHHTSEGALKNEALLNRERDDNIILQALTVHVGIYSQNQAVAHVPNKKTKSSTSLSLTKVPRVQSNPAQDSEFA